MLSRDLPACLKRCACFDGHMIMCSGCIFSLIGSASLELFIEPVFDGCRCCLNGNILVKNGQWTNEHLSGRNMTCIDGKMFVVDEVLHQGKDVASLPIAK